MSETAWFPTFKGPLNRESSYRVSIDTNGSVTFTSAALLTQPLITDPGALYAIVDLSVRTPPPPYPLRDLIPAVTLRPQVYGRRGPRFAFVFSKPQTLSHAKWAWRRALPARRADLGAGRVRSEVIIVQPADAADATARLAAAGLVVRHGLLDVLAELHPATTSPAEADEVKRRTEERARYAKTNQMLYWALFAVLIAARVLANSAPFIAIAGGIAAAGALLWVLRARRLKLSEFLVYRS